MILLDAGGAFILVIPLAFIFHFASTIFIEGNVLHYFGYNEKRKCFTDALVVNISSLIAGILLISPLTNWGDEKLGNDLHPLILGILFFVTILVEGLMLKFLHKAFPIKQLILATLLMNFITYAILSLLIYLFLS